MRSTLASSMLPSARKGVGAMGKTPLASTVSMESAFVWTGGGFQMIRDSRRSWQAQVIGVSLFCWINNEPAPPSGEISEGGSHDGEADRNFVRQGRGHIAAI